MNITLLRVVFAIIEQVMHKVINRCG